MEFVVFAIAALLLAAGLYTFWRTRQIEWSHRPGGSFRIVGGLRLHYFHFKRPGVQDHRPTLVFIHGASGNALDPLIAFKDRLEGRFDLLFVDRPGLGFSQREGARHSDPAAQARTLAHLLDDLGITDAVVIGHSLGASVTAALALARPDIVRGLVFLAPATHPWPGGVSWYYRIASLPVVGALFCWTITLPIAERVARHSVSAVFSPDPGKPGYADDIKLPLLFRPASFRANSQDVAQLKRYLLRQAADYPKIVQPALIVTGDRDGVVWPSIHSDGLLRDLPHARKIILKDAGHMPHHTHGEKIAAAISVFCDEEFSGKSAS